MKKLALLLLLAGTAIFGFWMWPAAEQSNVGEARTEGNGSGSVARSGRPEGVSIFDTTFLAIPDGSSPSASGETKSSKDRVPGDEPDILDPAADGKPRLPGGRSYSEAARALFDKVRERFPQNSVIPRQRSPEEVAEARLALNENRRLAALVRDGSASQTEVQRYYAYRLKRIEDSLQILEYSKQSGRISAESYERLRALGRRRIAHYRSTQRAALKRAQALEKQQ